jgi:hypothetical protein
VTFRCVSGYADPYLYLSDPDSDPDPTIFVNDLQDDNKFFFNLIFFLMTLKATFKDKKS